MLTKFDGILGCPLEAGQLFVIAGKTVDDANRMDINLSMGKSEEAAVPLHMSIRFNEGCIVRNTLIDGGGWGAEEREENAIDPSNLNPIVPGENFKVTILVGDDRFHIGINGAPFCIYPFRTTLEEVRTLVVNKDVSVITNVDHRQVFPLPRPISSHVDGVFDFSYDFPKALEPGKVFVMTAVPFGNPSGTFTIRLPENDNLRKLALFFNARFNQSLVICNSTNGDGGFGFEERNGDFPFQMDSQFKLAIGVTYSSFKIAVNGTFLTEFHYRSADAFNLVSGLKASGGNGLKLDITSIDFTVSSPDCDGFESFSDPGVDIF